MPSATFLNLPAEKREKFLRAAREEFARVPFADVSINRIIQAAGIPRGSFYMYFRDKAELFSFLLHEYGSRVAEQLEKALIAYQGDLFAAVLSFFDSIRSVCKSDKLDEEIKLFLSIFRLNGGPHSQILRAATEADPLFQRLIPYIDQSRLALKSENDLKDMFSILLEITGPAIMGCLRAPDPNAVRAQYINVLNILKRGMVPNAHSHS